MDQMTTFAGINVSPHNMQKILVIGANGQLGTELTGSLRRIFGTENVIASDLRAAADPEIAGPYEQLDVMDRSRLQEIISKHEIRQIYHLAAILSARGEKDPKLAWELNMTGLLHVLEEGRHGIEKIFWPSSIAVFGPDTPKTRTPQTTTMNPKTVYGISKLAGERWCEYYFEKYGVDVRSLRYPGLIGYKARPGGGTTDYAVEIFWKAILENRYDCFLREDTLLPMMYMDDAVRATIEIMQADAKQIKVRSSYNVRAFSFAPKDIYEAIKRKYPQFEISYSPDFRQVIADGWPNSIDDTEARTDWGWLPGFDLNQMVDTMLDNLELHLLTAK